MNGEYQHWLQLLLAELALEVAHVAHAGRIRSMIARTRTCECAISLKVGSKNTAFTPLTLSSAKPSWQMTWHDLKVEVLKHRPSHRYPNMRQECRTFKSVASCHL